ncbi:MAG TPA: bifunctional demethylmenaquinone methyltransferase/2-methoxy-6-polyprenyl-1,4-benzoquinol methylase UbiE [Syntrophorhabdaceae bacterium]|jgi:demethylmenaquinone methyltransferase/2-methoxy-6-polyprenyl-1,4-benzoquinol methylase
MAAIKNLWTPRKAEGTSKGLASPLEGETADFGFKKVPAGEKTHWVRNHFDTVAGKYDMMNTLLSFGIHYLWKRKAVNLLGLKPGERVIDVCGGTGDLSVLAVKKVGPAGHVVLYDINLKMMVTGRGKTTNAPARRQIAFVQGDAELIACKPESFNVAMVGFGIRNVTHMEDGFREMHRVLKPGGRFMCLEFSKPAFGPFRALYDLYSFAVMPLLGLLFVGSRKAYTYLPESIRLFPSPDELSRLLTHMGFRGVAYRRLSNGIAVVHTGIKA